MTASTTSPTPAIRELIAELARTEDALRGCRDAAGPRERSVRRRQEEIVGELRSHRVGSPPEGSAGQSPRVCFARPTIRGSGAKTTSVSLSA
jgi:hypothetical protein